MPVGKAFHTERFSGVMINTSSKSAASPKKAGYSIPELAAAWLNYCDHPESPNACEHLAIHLDQLFKNRLPNGQYSGILQGREDEVRQEAYLLVGDYLSGNKDLIAATEARNLVEISNQIHKSLAGSLRSVSRTLKKKSNRHMRLHAYGQDLDGCAQYANIHPAYRKSLWDLPFEAQRDLVFAAMRTAVREKLLQTRNANIAINMVSKGLNQRQIAAIMGVSPAAVHQRLAPVRRFLKSHLENQEFPLV